jgi:hypothetical protein
LNIANIDSDLSALKSTLAEYETAFDELVAIFPFNDFTNTKHKSAPAMLRLNTAAIAISDAGLSIATDNRQKIGHRIKVVKYVLVFSALTSLMTGAGCLVLFRLHVTHPLQQTSEALEKIIYGDGDLTGRMTIDYRMG